MKHHFSDFPRDPHDCDVVIDRDYLWDILHEGEDEIESYTVGKDNQSCIVRWKGIPHPVEYLYANDSTALFTILQTINRDGGKYASPDILYSLKKAHIHFPIKFDKHIKDLMFLREKLRQKKGISLFQDLSAQSDLLEQFPALTEMLFKDTEKRVGKLKTPKMNQSTEQFFGKSKNYVKSYYTHDNMHKAIAHHGVGLPMYEAILKDEAEVETDPIKWAKLTVQQKIWCVLEEVYVIALERKILPAIFENIDDSYTPKEAFDWALFRVCTTLCDGFFREFAVRAYDEIQKQYNPDYVDLFFKNISKYEKNEEIEEPA